MSGTYPGSCLCGTVRFEIAGAFDGFFLCHCGRCRKNSGSAHAANLFSRTARLDWLAGEDRVRTYAVPDTRHRRSFCTQCGSALPGMHIDGTVLVAPAGSLDGPLDTRPDAHIFIASRADWDDRLEDVPRHEAFPG
ncbi:GFA family protein [Sphingomonas colocasiae]|uniref:GFA family protein n=1 Tax=Sphingomonas colocasiae TaxID=1848973 RepID=A0ABS7PYD4_9SPHN|nr:GFA family protein [Sphingomonas colocasiae]